MTYRFPAILIVYIGITAPVLYQIDRNDTWVIAGISCLSILVTYLAYVIDRGLRKPKTPDEVFEAMVASRLRTTGSFESYNEASDGVLKCISTREFTKDPEPHFCTQDIGCYTCTGGKHRSREHR